MSILAMRHLRVIAAKEERETLLKDLSRLGCLEVIEPSADLREELTEYADSELSQIRSRLQELVNAMNVIRSHIKVKKGLLTPLPEVSEQLMLNLDSVKETEELANRINELARCEQQSFAEEGRLRNRREALVPWKDLDVRLDTVSGKHHIAQFGVVPALTPYEEVSRAVLAEVPDAVLYLASSDKEQHYLFLVCYRGDFDQANDTLRTFGYTKVQFKDAVNTAAKEIAELDAQLEQVTEQRAELVREIVGYKSAMKDLETAYDVFQTKLAQEAAKERMLTTQSTLVLEGWVPKPEEARLIKCLEKHGCAYELRDPQDEEEPPILTKNNKFVAAFGMITDMYSPPSYRGFDPNPFVAIFFSLFFGLMFSDAGYGLLMFLVVLFAKWRMKPKGTKAAVLNIAFFCSITTFVWGVLFGGWFGNAIPAIYELFTGNVYSETIALWFDPLQDPMKMLLYSFILGGVHLVAGMAIKAYMLIREGKVWDAIFDIGFWWVFLAGIVTTLLGVNGGMYILGAGALGLILTQGRHKKNVLMKLFSGVGSLYDVTGFLGDVLSYSRLLALSMSTAVIAQVINAMGLLTGQVGFFFVFVIGQIFNIAVSLIGTFVHTSRLQYVEFFGKFYEGGGEKFAPLNIKTKYVDVVKEEQ